MSDAEHLAAVLAATQQQYLTERDRFGGRSLLLALAETALNVMRSPAGVSAGTGPLPPPGRCRFLLAVLAETARVSPAAGDWGSLVRAACGYGGCEAEYAAMAAVPLPVLLAPGPAGGPRVVAPYCPYPHASGKPERLLRTAAGWRCDGLTPTRDHCLYEIPRARELTTGGQA